MRSVTTAALCLSCALLGARPAHALDPDKRLTQYLHTSWRTQDGSAPPPMFAVAQTAHGFLWFASQSHGIYRFDGIKFLPWSLASTFTSTTMNLVDDRNGGMWVITQRAVTHIKGELVASEFDLSGVLPHPGVSVDPDGSLWLVRGRNTVSDGPLCHATDQAVKCFGRADGVSISPAEACAKVHEEPRTATSDRRSVSIHRRSSRPLVAHRRPAGVRSGDHRSRRPSRRHGAGRDIHLEVAPVDSGLRIVGESIRSWPTRRFN